jgi:hypothetical protein
MKKQKTENKGMTLPELILGVLLLTAFTGVTVMVTQFTSRFLQPLNKEVKEEDISLEGGSDDMLNDFINISNAFDSIIEILSEQGIDKETILNLPKCTSLPALEWGIPSIDRDAIPKSYKVCIKPTSLSESSYEDLVNGGKPGIYILYSKPENGVSVNAIPIRRIFCRPKPFCKL